MDMEETQPDQNSLDFKMSEGLAGDSGGVQRRLQTSQGLMAIPISNADRKGTLMEKNIIAVLPDSSELLDGETATLIDVDRVNETGELDEVDLMRVKRELCEVYRKLDYIREDYICTLLYVFDERYHGIVF